MKAQTLKIKANSTELGTLALAVAVIITGAFWFLSHNYMANAAPSDEVVIESVTPSSGLTDGGNTIIIAGQNLQSTATYASLSTGKYSSSCGIRLDGRVNCWGYNGNGQLGNGTTTTSQTPVQVSNLTDVQQVSAGSYHTCAVKTDNTAWCWGSNNYSQLGNGTTTTSQTPVQVSNLTNAQQISASYYGACALKSDNTVWCWGHNGNGQLGNGTTTNSSTPVQVSSLTNVAQVSAGSYHTCALKTDNTVWCWGYNDYGQLGNGTTTTSQTPVQVSNLTDVQQVSAGSYHTCAVKTDNTAWCWGYNDTVGQLGNGTIFNSSTPVQVSSLTNVAQVSAGSRHTCAVKTDNTAWCWGSGYYGQIGDGTNTGSYYTPVQVSNLTNVAQVSAGSEYTCALKTDDTAWCWGRNIYGQLGNGANTNSSIPVQIADTMMDNLTRVALDGQECTNLIVVSIAKATCRAPAHAAGSVDVVGNYAGGGTTVLAGNYTYVDRNIISVEPSRGPIEGGTELIIHGTGFMLDDKSQSITAADYSCTKDVQAFTAPSGGEYMLEAWGAEGGYYLRDRTVAGKGGYSYGTVKLSEGETVYVYVGCTSQDASGGYNGGGDGHAPLNYNQLTPGLVEAGYSYNQIAAGTNGHTCALKTDNTVWCWGYNIYGQLGNGTNTGGYYTPVQVSNLTDAQQISAGEYHTCAVKTDNTAWCWGGNGNGQLGNGTITDSQTPVQVSNLTNAQQISAGEYHTCAVKTDNTAWCWGGNGYGQLGNGTNTGGYYTPVQVSNLTDAQQISTGVNHTCALKTNDTVWCWGRNIYGQLGNGTTTNSSTPVQVSGLTNVAQISANGGSTCALKTDNTVWCWGYNIYGQLGNGTTTNSSTPVQVSGLTNVAQISANGGSTCALKTDNTVWCWGYNIYGQLGNGTTTNSSTPVQVSSLTNVAQISAGNYHTCALKTDGTAWCWGSNYNGQLGNGHINEGNSSRGYGGGGSTDLRLVGGAADNPAGLYSRIMVAGGGAGGYYYANNPYYYYTGGYGGGSSGGPGGVSGATGAFSATGGSQTSGGLAGYYYDANSSMLSCGAGVTNVDYCGGNDGQFGIGGSTNDAYQTNTWWGAGGGGGWYGGGSGFSDAPSAGGGSGYVLTATSARPSGYSVSDDYILADAGTIAGNQEFLAPDGSLETGHAGDGYARVVSMVNLTEVYIGGVRCRNLEVISKTEARCTVPAHAAGYTDVTGNFANGAESTLSNGYLYIDPTPTVTAISPSKGITDMAGQVITITGTNLNTATAVTVGGEACTPITNKTATSLACTLPSFSTVGSKSVVVTNPDGSSPPSTLYEVIAQYIGISAPNSLNLNVNPSSFSSDFNTVTVSTNNPNGYSLSLKASSSSLTNTAATSATIPTLTNSFTPTNPASSTQTSNLIGNSSFWAYRVTNQGSFGSTTTKETNTASTNYSWAAIPTTNQTIRTGTVTDNLTTNTPQSTDIWFGVSPTNYQASGQYQVVITYTVVGR